MLATQINHMVKTDVLKRFAIIRITDCICNSMSGKKVVIILNLEIVDGNCGGQVGDPQDIAGDRAPMNGAPKQQPGYNVIPPQHQQQHQQQQQQQQHQQPYIKPDPGQAGGQSNYQPPAGGYGGTNNNNNNFNNGNNFNSGNQYQNQNQGGGYGGNQQGGMPGGGYGQQGGQLGGQQGYQNQNPNGSGGGYGGGGYNQAGGGNRGGSGPLHHDDSGPTTPIASMSPYIGKWCIQGRIIVKSTMRHYKNAKGEGRLFNIDIMDASGDIRGTFFNDDADRWMDQLETNKVYKVRNGNIKPANKQFNQTRSEWEITFGRDTTFEPCPESAAPKVTYNFVPIEAIEQLDTNSILDIIGVVQSADPISEITVKSGANAGNKIAKRDVTLVDQSLKTIRLTLWDGNKDMVQEGSAAPVIAIKNVKVGDFQGKNVSTTRSSICEINPDMPTAHALRGWYDVQGKNAAFTSMSGGGGGTGKDPRKFLSAIKDENMGHDSPAYFTVRGWVSFIRSEGTWCYCSNPANKKKVIESGDKWLDESTGTTIDKCERRYILSMVCSDHTGSSWLSAFNDQAIKIMGGITADEMYELSQADGAAQFKATFNANNFMPYIFKVRAKAETWQDESRVKCVIQDLTPLDFKEGSRELLDLIKAYGVC